MKYILITFMHAVSTPDITTPQFVVWKKNEIRNGIRFAKSKEDDVSISSKSLISIQAKIFNNFYLSWFVSSVRSHSLYQTCLMLSTEMTALVVFFFILTSCHILPGIFSTFKSCGWARGSNAGGQEQYMREWGLFYGWAGAFMLRKYCPS